MNQIRYRRGVFGVMHMARALSRRIGSTLLITGITLSTGGAFAREPLPHVDLTVTLDPAQRTLDVQATLSAAAGTTDLAFDLTAQAGVAATDLMLPASSAARARTLHYHLALKALTEMDHRETLGDLQPTADARGSFLPASSLWHPAPHTGAFTYRVKLILPAGQRGLVAGRLEEETFEDLRTIAQFSFNAPAQGIDLMAGPYQVEEKYTQGNAGVRLRTYFHPELKDLARDYLDSAAGYIERYAQEIGSYPYSEFSIVSSPTPTGFGMPTLTYLGIDVLRLPFIRHTSLGHEVLHNWWGNGVYVDYATGNWCEGLTAFMADYAFKEAEGPEAARAARLSWLRDLSALPASESQTLRGFVSRTHGASQIVGYNKASMLFLVLRNRIGPDAFRLALRNFWRQHQFRTASWTDLQSSFQQASGQDLSRFFSQYLDRADLPDVRVQTVERVNAEAIRMTLEQSSPPFELDVPLAFEHAGNRELHTLRTAQPQTQQMLKAGDAGEILLDPDLQMLRRLDDAELPAILRQVMVAARVRLLTPDPQPALQALARQLAEKLLDNPPIPVEAAPAAGDAQLIIGTHDAVDRALTAAGLARPPALQGKGSAQVWAAYGPSGRSNMLVVSARDEVALQALLRPLPHYGAQSYLSFDGGRAIVRGVWPVTPRRVATP